LLEGFDNDLAIGRSYRDAPEIDGMVLVETGAKLKDPVEELAIGNIIPVKITGAMAYDLAGTPIR
jgi:ribosomal protein S12 methylthiotransferase